LIGKVDNVMSIWLYENAGEIGGQGYLRLTTSLKLGRGAVFFRSIKRLQSADVRLRIKVGKKITLIGV
jgi:hypothetical protein